MNQKQVVDESRCYEYCSKQAKAQFDKSNYSKAFVYLENARRSLIQLEGSKKPEEQESSKFHVIKIYASAAIVTGFLLYGLITSGGRTW
ncbi:hypothetical protein [Virgibacillus ndiopensis]|uniref:hypothetical protein n=1 Tax=Virgibacillus ndiopensis TaxID=2004408 RepID=UPI000C07DAAA|nr:hypothetical protein [Virgibacillus ndiopensis]